MKEKNTANHSIKAKVPLREYPERTTKNLLASLKSALFFFKGKKEGALVQGKALYDVYHKKHHEAGLENPISKTVFYGEFMNFANHQGVELRRGKNAFGVYFTLYKDAEGLFFDKKKEREV